MAAAPPSPPRTSPPKAVVDASPLQQAMDRNKESLKVKLMMRRPLNQLVAQGIMPPLKTPPAFYEQRKQLERAKTGDLLKAKIQRRPDRQELERRHILELQEGHVDPSLAEKQRMLKKARLADQLNDQLSHRPGPLELIQKNILHTEEPIEIAVKQGLVAFKATSEGAHRRPEHPSSYLGPEEESPPPPSPAPSTLSPPSAAASPRATLSPLLPALHAAHPAPGKDKNRKKSKSKAVAKARTIKFHEYKGPPSAQKASSPLAPHDETSYEILLQQQQLFLQWQLESQHKYPQLVLTASPAPSPAASEASESLASPPHAGSPAPAPPPLPPPFHPKIDDMKVSDLKAELKRRNLPVSGPKPQLIERLRPHLTEQAPPPPPPTPSINGDEASSAGGSPERGVAEAMEIESQPPTPQPPEDIVATQRRVIETLQRELERSQRQLEAVRREAAAGRGEPQGRRLALHHLQAKIQSHQLAAHIQQLEAMQAAAERQRAAAAPPPAPPPPPVPPQYVLTAPAPARIAPARIAPDHLLQLIAAQPGGDGLKMQFTLKDGLEGLDGLEALNGKKNVGIVLNGVKVVPITILPPEPPRYEQRPVAPEPQQPATPSPPPPPPPSSVKSQSVDDVLEILIKNGELPASAAHQEIPEGGGAGDEFLSTSLMPPGGASDELLAHALQPDMMLQDELPAELMEHSERAVEFDALEVPDDSMDRRSHEPMSESGILDELIGRPPQPDFDALPDLAYPSSHLDDEDMSNHAFLEERPRAPEGLDLRELGIDLESLDAELGRGESAPSEYMDMDEWIESLWPREQPAQCDPLLGGAPARAAPRPARPHLSWDRVDFAAT